MRVHLCHIPNLRDVIYLRRLQHTIWRCAVDGVVTCVWWIGLQYRKYNAAHWDNNINVCYPFVSCRFLFGYIITAKTFKQHQHMFETVNVTDVLTVKSPLERSPFVMSWHHCLLGATHCCSRAHLTSAADWQVWQVRNLVISTGRLGWSNGLLPGIEHKAYLLPQQVQWINQVRINSNFTSQNSQLRKNKFNFPTPNNE